MTTRHRPMRPCLASLAFLLCAAAGAAAPDAPPAPDYRTPPAWAVLPGKETRADLLPPNVPRVQRDDVAVFFVHPTTYLSARIDNAAFDAAGTAGERVDEAVLPFQASLFNFSTRLYAPRYRQASLKAIISNDPASYAVDELAYQDVARAFARFLELEPQRPFILASHSQGSIHALRLLQQAIAGTPLQARLVGAYLAGVALPLEIESLGLKLCRTADDTGCLMSWNSERAGHEDTRRLQNAVIWWHGGYQPIGGRPLACFNPLDAQLGGSAPAAANLGAVPKSRAGASLPEAIAGRIGASCANGLLGVDVPFSLRREFADVLTLTGVYHDFDFDLFYVNVREDALRRTDAWLKARAGR